MKSKTKRKSSRIGSSVAPETRVREALLAALTALHESFPSLTLAQYLIALEVLVAETRNEPHTLTTLKEKLEMPHATASRLVWTLTAEGGDLGALRYEPHPTDRRLKYIRIERKALRKLLPHGLMQSVLALQQTG
jgi:DNA-binding MarR family transcriptional regulator